MKKIFIFFMIVSLYFTLAYAQEATPSKIEGVTLFSDQALVKREATAKVSEGVNEILIELEAFDVDRDSVSAKVFGGGELFSVQFKDIYLEDEPQEEIKALIDKIKKLEDDKKALVNQQGVLAKKEKFLDSLIDFSKVQVPREIKTNFPSTEDLEQTLLFLDKSQNEINSGYETLDPKIEDLNKEINALARELQSLKGYSKKSKNQIEIVFNSEKEQEVGIEAGYLVYGASWNPLYKVNVPLDLKEVNLTMFSKMVQKTGEDWDDIKLAVSNVIPLKGVGVPDLNSWYLDIARRRWLERKESFGAMPVREVAITKTSLDGDAGEKVDNKTEQEAGFAQAQKKELPLSFEYELPQALSIESKDKETILPLFSREIEGEFFHYVVPQVNPLTFLVCKASSDKELLSGYLNVYFGGRFVGKTYLGEKKPGEDFNINLGADRGVKVKREKIKDKVQETFFGKIERKTIVREMSFKMTIENLKEEPVKIKVLDSIPVSKTDKIVVKDVKITPGPNEKDYEDEEGVMLWEFDIKPKEKKEIEIEFVVTYPKDLPVFGM